jgi:dihydroorotase
VTSAPALLIRGGTVVDATGSRRADVAVADGTVLDVGTDLQAATGTRVLDAGGLVVAPGLVDLHVHMREPGNEEAESVATAARAAALGGFTAVLAMPNTDPPIDSAAVVSQVLSLGRDALVEVAVAGAITIGRRGERLAPMAEMAGLGVRVFTDDGTGVADSRLMRRALEYASALGVTLAQHCEDAGLAAGGHMHEGEWSARLGIPGIPSVAEELMVARDLALARLTGGRLHLLHLSTSGSVALVRAAKAAGGLSVTAEAAPHHLSLTDAEVAGYDPVFKVNPPLRSPTDVAAVRAGLADGTIDAIATDHAPHSQQAKEAPFEEAPPGMIGLETALAVAITYLVPSLGLAGILARLSWQPAAIAGLEARHGGPIAPGRPANLCVIDPSARWMVDPAASASRSRNTPFAGRTVGGRVVHTVYRGEPVVIDSQAQR